MTMARYIDADALIKEHIEKEKGRYGSCLVVGDNRFLQRFLNAPTADVVERKKGKWKEWNDHYSAIVFCSECGYEDGLPNYHFCPNCGAEMGDDDAEIH